MYVPKRFEIDVVEMVMLGGNVEHQTIKQHYVERDMTLVYREKRC